MFHCRAKMTRRMVAVIKDKTQEHSLAAMRDRTQAHAVRQEKHLLLSSIQRGTGNPQPNIRMPMVFDFQHVYMYLWTDSVVE